MATRLDHDKSSAIEQNDVAPDHHVFTVRRRRRQVRFEVTRAGNNLGSQAGRQRAADYQLTLKAGGKTISFGKAGRQVVAVFANTTHASHRGRSLNKSRGRDPCHARDRGRAPRPWSLSSWRS